MSNHEQQYDAIVIGAGFTGLSCAYELTRRGWSVLILEKDEDTGGLAGCFRSNGQLLEKFYHHWFTNDQAVLQLAKNLRTEAKLLSRTTQTAVYRDQRFYRLSTPLDVLRFDPLSMSGRIRLGSLVLKARRVNDYKQIEGLTCKEWLLKLCGPEVYSVVWEPLLRGKFGDAADDVSAVWFWNKLVLRGGSRNKSGHEQLLYYQGGFGELLHDIAKAIELSGGLIRTGVEVRNLLVENGSVNGVITSCGPVKGQTVIATCSLPVVSAIAGNHLSTHEKAKLNRIRYLANVSLVLELKEKLSDIYWLNVNDIDFPFVGIIEHTNFEPPQTYGNRHIVYLSKYLPETSEMYQMDKNALFAYSVPYIQNMFPAFETSSVLDYHVFKASHAQPIAECYYSRLIPDGRTSINNFYIASMAQIYPQDRGTNYAIQQGRDIAALAADAL